MRLLFLCDARIQESLSEGVCVGGGGGVGEARLPKNNRNIVFLTLNCFTVIHRGPTFFRVGGPTFPGGGGGGGPNAYFHKNAYNL